MTILVTRSNHTSLPDGLLRLAECGRTGCVLPVGPMAPVEMQALAAALGVPGLPLREAARACAHTLGNPRHLIALLAELPVEVWSRESALPAPRMYSRMISRTLEACSAEARRLVEAMSVLGNPADLSTVTALAELDEPLVAVEEACQAGLLVIPEPAPLWRLASQEPLVQAAVYGQLGGALRARLHSAAAGLIDDELRRRFRSAPS